jgi:hypothetical protein
MPTATTDSAGSVQGIRFVGRTTGPVKTLRGFRKGQHTVPDAVNPATNAFLARLCAEELREEAEAFFQSARVACGYKRRDIAVTLGSPQALVAARDFTLEISCSFVAGEPAAYQMLRSLHGCSGRDFLRSQACADVFGGRFEELVFALTKGATVESVIDAVEGCEVAALRIAYPSDCSHCLLSVEGVGAQVRFDGAELAMVFPKNGSPAELLDGFLAVRAVFSLSKSRVLSGLLN